jgi:hypothetical protein
MATTDEFIKYDLRFFKEFGPYLGLTETDMIGITKMVKLGLLQRERLAEIAISMVSKVDICSIHGQDLADGSDVKTVVSGIRNNNKAKGSWTHSFPVRQVHSKTGALRIVAFNKLLDKFHYFAIPNEAFQHCSQVLEIIVERRGNWFKPPEFSGDPQLSNKWWQYEYKTFEEMCLKRPEDLSILPSLR